jgi:hypothetical protein
MASKEDLFAVPFEKLDGKTERAGDETARRIS